MMILFGWIMLVLSVVVQMLFLQRNEEAVSVVSGIICTIQCVLLVVTILPVERALKENFNQDGTKNKIFIKAEEQQIKIGKNNICHIRIC